VIALKGGEVVFTGLPQEIDRAKFKEIYGEEAVEVRAGLADSSATPAAA
jgi:ABC-type phosphate/phosphonate transport system ATPase subunit